jgi:NADH-quinone oxidoreductase subunit N
MNLFWFTPELLLILGSLVVFVVALGSGRGRLAARVTAFTGLACLAACAVSLGWKGDLFFRAYRIDLFSQLFKLFIVLGMTAITLFGRRLPDIRDDIRPEYFLFILLGSLGLMMMVSSVELMSLVISLEIASCALYLLVPLRRERPGLRIQMESAAKYVMFGLVATGVLVFGMSYLFGLTGSTYFNEIAPELAGRWSDPPAVAAIALILSGLFFKLAAFPMHIWAPDVYQGASNETTAYITAVPKVAAVGVLVRFVMLADPSGRVMVLFLTIVSIASMSFGNLVAIVQKDIKRMFGYSAIAHAGYVVVGLVTLRETGYAASMFYIFAFLAMSLPVFLVICQVSREGENLLIDDLAGLHARAPLAALVMAAGLFALAGIPPFVGFIGKFQLMAAALDRGMVTLVVLVAVNTAIGVYYYLNVVRVMYLESAGDRPAVSFDSISVVLGVILLMIVVVLGVIPGSLMNAAVSALRGLSF